jgi:hypothetical protein
MGAALSFSMGFVMRTSARDIAIRLHGKRNGRGWMCHCPGPMHRNGDRNPSLSVRDGRNGRPLLYCFAGCEYGEIVAALEHKGLSA